MAVIFELNHFIELCNIKIIIIIKKYVIIIIRYSSRLHFLNLYVHLSSYL